MSDLHEVIEDAVQDATNPIETPETTDETPVEAPVEAQPEPSLVPEAPTNEPVKDHAEPEVDTFAKTHGLPTQRPGERENRIPYSRVKTITANAEKKRDEFWTDEKTKWEKDLTDYKTKVTDYETRLKQVGEFEQVMLRDPSQFLNMLTKIPAYKQIFEGLAPKAQAQPQPAPNSESDMPQPDQTLADGTKVYSMEGFRKYEAWKEKQITDKILGQLGSRLQPLEQERQLLERQRQFHAWQQAVIPQIQQQIDQARKWVQFSENEQEIVKALQDNPQLSLQEAYIQVVVPKLSASKNTVRQQVIQDLQKAPTATSVPAGGTRPVQQSAGKKDLESIIAESVKNLGR